MLRLDKWEILGEEEQGITKFRMVFSDEDYTDEKVVTLTAGLSQFIINSPVDAEVEPVYVHLTDSFDSEDSTVTAEMIIRYPTRYWPEERETQEQLIDDIRNNIIVHLGSEF